MRTRSGSCASRVIGGRRSRDRRVYFPFGGLRGGTLTGAWTPAHGPGDLDLSLRSRAVSALVPAGSRLSATPEAPYVSARHCSRPEAGCLGRERGPEPLDHSEATRSA